MERQELDRDRKDEHCTTATAQARCAPRPTAMATRARAIMPSASEGTSAATVGATVGYGGPTTSSAAAASPAAAP